MNPPNEPPASNGLGAIIGDKYRLDSPIGEGGMATVWRATHLTVQRPVAVKVLHVQGGDPWQVTARFLREARLAAAVRHPHVTDIMDFGTTGDGRPFMVMELLEGQNLAQRLSDGPLSLPQVVRIMARTLSGLQAVHDAGIVHRDLKPENIFLEGDADSLQPKLFDFGISGSVGDSAGLQESLPSHEYMMAGTPQYMSPEQARGMRDIDHRTDIYSMGVILYELLAGELPFDSDNTEDLIIMIATQEPPNLRALRPDLGESLPRIAGRAMARDPDGRFQTAREMRNTLLEAAARTAATLSAPAKPRGETVPTRPDVPGFRPQELMDAVGDAYEPGDSGVIDLAEATSLERGDDGDDRFHDPES